MSIVRTFMRGVAFVLVSVLAACKGNPTCEKAVERSMTCPDKDLAALSSGERAQLKTLLIGTCANAMNDSIVGTSRTAKARSKALNASMRKRATCMAAAADCAAAKLCDSKAD
jgi:hypothetical protein